ncbi:MAG: DUF2812 domain-containing protein [Clostridia bacterium]|nr:DUF2812 domain-containing protein [Clostridia bacterium]
MPSRINKPYNYDIFELPAYLSKQSADGLHVHKISRNYISFKQGEPKQYDYNILPINNSTELDSIKELSGWEPVLFFGEFCLLRAPQGTPFTVVADTRLTLVKLSFMRTMYIIRLSLAIMGALFSVIGIIQYWHVSPTLTVISAVLLPVLIFFGLRELFPLLRLIKSIKKLRKGCSDAREAL